MLDFGKRKQTCFYIQTKTKLSNCKTKLSNNKTKLSNSLFLSRFQSIQCSTFQVLSEVAKAEFLTADSYIMFSAQAVFGIKNS